MFIAVEGIDGAGKSTAIAFLKREFCRRGFDVAVTTGTTFLSPWTAWRLIADSSVAIQERTASAGLQDWRAGDALRRILLQNSSALISDRSWWTAFVRSGGTIAADLSNHSRPGDVAEPDVTLFMDTSPLVASDRICQRTDISRHEHLDQLQLAQRRYGDLISSLPAHHEVKYVRTRRDLNTVADDLVSRLRARRACPGEAWVRRTASMIAAAGSRHAAQSALAAIQSGAVQRGSAAGTVSTDPLQFLLSDPDRPWALTENRQLEKWLRFHLDGRRASSPAWDRAFARAVIASSELWSDLVDFRGDWALLRSSVCSRWSADADDLELAALLTTAEDEKDLRMLASLNTWAALLAVQIAETRGWEIA